MKKNLLATLFCSAFLFVSAFAQNIKADKVPSSVKAALQAKYPDAKGVSWEKEKGNYEANWGGKSGEDNSVLFTPSGKFLEMEKLIPVSDLPNTAVNYVKDHYKSARIHEAEKITDAKGKISYEIAVNKQELVFDESGNLIKK